MAGVKLLVGPHDCHQIFRFTQIDNMQKTASGIVGGFMEDIFGKELKPWQENEKPGTEP